MRAVLLRYADGASDLVLVAHRSVLDAPSLRAVADTVTTGADLPHLARPSWPPATEDSDHKDLLAGCGTRPAWGAPDPLGAPRTVQTGEAIRVPLPDTADDTQAMLLVASAIVLGRYEDQEQPVVAALTTDRDRPADALGAFEFGTLFPADLTGALTLGDLLTRAQQLLAEPIVRRYPEQHINPTPPAGKRALVGVLPEAPDGYLPCQAALFPLTLVPRRTPDGTLWVETYRQPAEVGEAAARRFARHVAHVRAWMSGRSDSTLPDDADLLDTAEREAVAVLGRAPAELQWQPDRIDALFTRQAARTPDAVAVSYGTERLTYAQLH
ncbi:hypothetical protein [Streptomyces malaysiensis]|uniref:hypothetical protein n=1 Tax=Streptomyces malaysiensis TaxID=92644 RepID=UPI0037130733